MITHQHDAYKWEFLFLGANQDAIAAGASIGVPDMNSMSFAGNSVGTKAAFASTSSNVSSYRMGAASAGYTQVDRAAQVAAGAKA